jgi:hypothetical protein
VVQQQFQQPIMSGPVLQPNPAEMMPPPPVSYTLPPSQGYQLPPPPSPSPTLPPAPIQAVPYSSQPPMARFAQDPPADQTYEYPGEVIEDIPPGQTVPPGQNPQGYGPPQRNGQPPQPQPGTGNQPPPQPRPNTGVPPDPRPGIGNQPPPPPQPGQGNLGPIYPDDGLIVGPDGRIYSPDGMIYGPNGEIIPPGAIIDGHYHGDPHMMAPPPPPPPKRPKATDLGLGGDYLPFAPFEIDHAKPGNYFTLRADAFANWRRPDRIEYLWARSGGVNVSGIPGLGPDQIEESIDLQVIHFHMETGGDKISAIVDLPIRSLDPELNANTTGLGDMYTGAKAVVFSEGRSTVSTLFLVHIPTGLASRGLGNGHVSMEPGLLFNYQASCTTYFHGEVKYWFPIAGNIDWAGQYLRYGIGVGHLLYERPNSDFAITATLEAVGWSILDGRESVPGPSFADLDPEAFVTIYPGVRILMGEKLEVGISSGFSITSQRWYDSMFRLDIRQYF